MAYEITADDLKEWQPKEPGALESFAGGVVNPNVNILNRILGPAQKVAQIAGLPRSGPSHHWQIPHIPSRGGIAHGIGEIVGYGIPFTGEERLVSKGLQEAQKALPALEKLAATKLGALGRVGKTAAIGATVGAAARDPGTTAEEGAIGGGVGGTLGEGIGQTLHAVGTPLFRSARFQNFKNAFLQRLPKKAAGAARRDLINHIVDMYQNARQKARTSYNALWNKFGTEEKTVTEPEYEFVPEAKKEWDELHPKLVNQEIKYGEFMRRLDDILARHPDQDPQAFYQLPEDERTYTKTVDTHPFTVNDIPNTKALMDKDGANALLDLEDLPRNAQGNLDPEQFSL